MTTLASRHLLHRIGRSFRVRSLSSTTNAITYSSVASRPSSSTSFITRSTIKESHYFSLVDSKPIILRRMSNGTKAPATETDTDTAIDTDEQHEETALNISADVVQEIEDAATTTTIINHEEYTQELIIQLPSIGDDNITGKVVQWYKAEGDIVRTNDTICDVETDLFTFGMDVEDENEGIMKEILVKEGEEGHKPGTPICIIMHKPMN